MVRYIYTIIFAVALTFSGAKADITIYHNDGVSPLYTGNVYIYDTSGDFYQLSQLLFQHGSTFYSYLNDTNCGWRYFQTNKFCGFIVYTSTDLVNWTNQGLLFDYTAGSWINNCQYPPSPLSGCYVPRVIYNAANNNFVLWINDGAQPNYYDVLTSSSPTGPFTLVTPPTHLPITTGGDEALFVDTDGTGYITHETTGAGQIYIDRLNSTYTDAVAGSYIAVSGASGDTPWLMGPVNGTYHLFWSGVCTACLGAPTHHATASSVLGTWTVQADVSSDSCGYQFTGVYPIQVGASTYYLWANAGPYRELATFTGSTVSPIVCTSSTTIPGLTYNPGPPLMPTANQGDESFVPGFNYACDITNQKFYLQEFVPSQTLTNVGAAVGVSQNFGSCTSGCDGANNDFIVSLVNISGHTPSGVLSSTSFPTNGLAGPIKYNPIRTTVKFPGVTLTSGVTYGLELSGSNTNGCYGVASSALQPYSAGLARVTTNGGSTWSTLSNTSLRFSIFGSGGGGRRIFR
jgi:hypothetical protein